MSWTAGRFRVTVPKKSQIAFTFLGVLCLCGPQVCPGAELQVEVTGISATQAILRYTSLLKRPCTVEVSESNTFRPLVHDVDPALFEGGSDARSGRLNWLGEHVFVVGQRKAQRARDGRWYSRALQANTVHYFRVDCVVASATGSFRTANIALGDSYNEMFPPDPDVAEYTPAGAYAWPEFLSWTDRNESLVDPQTGILLKRATMPQDFLIDWLGDESIGTVIDSGGKWSNPDAAKADDSAAAEFGGGNTAWLFLRDDRLDLGDRDTPTLTYLGRTINSVQVGLKAWCTGACAGDDRKVELCLTVNGVSCASGIREQALGTSAMLPWSAPLLVGTTKAIMDFWTDPGKQPLDRTQFMVRAGTVDVNGRGVQWRSGNYFHVGWTSGSRIAIGGVEYEIASVEGLKSLTLKSDAGTANGTVYRAANSGVLLRKKTSSADRISLQYAQLKLGISHLPEGWPSSGSPEICQAAATTDVDGNEGYRCVITDAVPVVYWINRSNGESKPLGLYTTDSRGGQDGWNGSFCSGWFSAAEPEAFYCMVWDNAPAPHQVVVRCELSGKIQTRGWNPVCTNLTPASRGADVAAAAYGIYRREIRPHPLSMRSFWRAERENSTGVHARRAGFAGVAGGFGPRTSAAGMRRRGEQLHRRGAEYLVGGAGALVHNAYGVLHGRYGLVLGGGAVLAGSGRARAGAVCFACDQWGTDGDGDEPGAVPRRCSRFGSRGAASLLDGDGGRRQPRDPSPYGGETGAAGELQNAEPGDVLQVEGELTQLLSKSGSRWVLRRGFRGTPIQAHGASAQSFEQCLSRRFGRDTSDWSWSWDYLHDPTGANPDGTTVRREYDFDHPAGRGGVVVGMANYLDCPWPEAGAMRRERAEPGAAPDVIVNGNAGFAGVAGGAPGNFAENHASYAQVAAPESERTWMLDGRPFEPGPEISGAFTPVGGQLYKLSTTTRDGDEISGAARLSRLLMYADFRILRHATVARREQRGDRRRLRRGARGFIQVLRFAKKGRVPSGRADGRHLGQLPASDDADVCVQV